MAGHIIALLMATAVAAERPNVLLIAIDDLRPLVRLQAKDDLFD